MTAGDIGVEILINAGGYDMTGATCTLIAAPSSPIDSYVPARLTPVVVNAGGLTCSYITTGDDFTVGEQWDIQLEVVPAGGTDKFTSPKVNFFVYPHL